MMTGKRFTLPASLTVIIHGDTDAERITTARRIADMLAHHPYGWTVDLGGKQPGIFRVEVPVTGGRGDVDNTEADR